ncbi:unnamed protein product [Orchesella dallaii]
MSCNACFPQLSYNTSPASTAPINLLRTGKDVLPYRQGVVVTTYMGDYIPPVLMPGYQGHLPGVSTACGNTYGGATQKHFRNFRQELLGRQIRPKFAYGRFPCDFTPFPDCAVAQRAIITKKLSETPNVRSPGVDFNRRLELLKFYYRSQNYRDYYLDKTDKVLNDPFFYVGTPWPVRCPVDERTFKIRRSQDACNKPGFLGPRSYCGAMPCIERNGYLQPFTVPKLPRPPFQCDAVKPKNEDDWEVLLV